MIDRMPELPRMYPVWVAAENTRVYGIDADPDGHLWFTGSLPQLHRYNSRSGAIDTIVIPDSHGGSQCIWCGDKIYVLPQSNPHMVIYHIAEGRLEQVDKPFPEANLWYGEVDRERNLLYLPERSRPCLVVWDVAEETGRVHSFPEAGVLPAIGEVEWSERLYAHYVPGAVTARRVYYDPECQAFVAENVDPIAPRRPGSHVERFEVTYRTTNEDGSFLADGRVIRHDRQTGERHESEIPGYGEDFTFIGGGVFFQGWQFNCLSTYRQTYSYDPVTDGFIPRPGAVDLDIGIDGHPYHFMDRLLAYHPEADTFDMLIPDVPADRYPQMCYNRTVGEHLYITANNIWSPEKGRALGAVEKPVGQLLVLQSHPLDETESAASP